LKRLTANRRHLSGSFFMNYTIYTAFTAACWWILALLWLALRFLAKPTAYRQSIFGRLVPNLGIVLGFLLVYAGHLSFGLLGRRIIPHTAAWGLAGATICAAGVALAIWARWILGRNWSGIPALKEQHELVTRGPYHMVRHPIYAGFLAGLLGSAITVGLVRCFCGFAILFVAFAFRVRFEEALMMKQFPDQYPAYRRRVRALIPYVF
jgi:protein-S-isoprenylcysteine O-methyltransferase Ste14